MKKRIIIQFEEKDCKSCMLNFNRFIMDMGFRLRTGAIDKDGYFRELWTKEECSLTKVKER